MSDSGSRSDVDALQAFHWERQPLAAQLVRDTLEDFLARCPQAAQLARRMAAETGTRFIDWVAHLVLPENDPRVPRLREAGYREVGKREGVPIFEHPGGVFPTFTPGRFEVALKVDSVADFLAANDLDVPIDGEPLCDLRVATVYRGDGCSLAVIERHGSRGFDLPGDAPPHAIRRLVHLERFRTRRRNFDDDAAGFDHVAGFDHAEKLIDDAIADLGVHLTCDLFFHAEREYWQRRNRAAQFQKARQDRLGLGWANHDHHTYRSSREDFTRLVRIWEKLGFHCRERFYAGREAGWGAQVMEQPVTGITTFNDVDLSPDELLQDFAHEPLPPRDSLGTVGLWCALHGEAFLQAGMHHLECQFDFDSLRDQMQQQGGIAVMKPFTDFPYLRQAFTEGERWPVSAKRIERLLSRGLITREQADQFRTHGAIGSHLENLERNDGFKGFNQKGVSEIIAATDPRKHALSSVAG